MSNITVSEIEAIRQEKYVLLAHDSSDDGSRTLYQNLSTQQYTVLIITFSAAGDGRKTFMTLGAAVDAYNSFNIKQAV